MASETGVLGPGFNHIDEIVKKINFFKKTFFSGTQNRQTVYMDILSKDISTNM